MTQFVAAWAPPTTALDPAVADRLAAALSTAGDVSCIKGPRSAVVYWDSRIWPGDSAYTEGGRSAVVAGDPVLGAGTRPLEHSEAVRRLARRMLGDAASELGAAQGSYAALAWDDAGAMVAGTDKLGVRPLYWAVVDRVVYLSTAAWVLARLPQIPKTPDLRAVVEACAFGAPLADRTLISSVRALGAGEYLDLTGDAPLPRRYWDWSALAPSGVPERDLPAFVSEAFNQAVDSRLYGQPRVFAFLSGGMDSRLIVSRLRAQGTEVSALNMAPPGSQDLLFGRMAAQATGTRLFEFNGAGTDFLTRRELAFRAWAAEPAHAGLSPAQTRLAWSGDGGSVGLGHVYLTEEIVAVARQGDLEATARAIQSANRLEVSPRSFASRHRDLVRWPLEGIKEDLRSRNGVEPGRNCHLFFMLNDQRRHLVQHFETLHQHRLDLVLPFFDARFVSAVCSSPIDPFLLHRLYNRIMAAQPFGLGHVPWQVYPGHEPCPAKSTEAARLQWDEGWFDRDTERRMVRSRMLRALRFALSAAFPKEFLHRPTVVAAAALGALGVDRFGHLLKPIGPMCEALAIPAR